MPRFLIVLGIMFTLVAAVELSDETEEIATVAELPDEATSRIAQPAAAQAASQKAEPAVQRELPRKVEPADQPVRRTTPAAVVAAEDTEDEDSFVEPSQILSSASVDVTIEQLEASFALLSPYEMKTAVQTELKRLACYEAAIDGIWGNKSREAVRLFNSRGDVSFHLNESVELLAALKHAPDGLCSDACRQPGSCEIVASVETVTEQSGAAITEDITEQAKEEAPSYLPPWMRGGQVAEAEDETELSESYGATHTSVSRRVYVQPRPSRRTVYRSSSRSSRKKDWLPDSWPGN